MPQLKKGIKDKILSSNELIGFIADRARTVPKNVENHINNGSKMLALPIYQDSIREACGLPNNDEIFVEV